MSTPASSEQPFFIDGAAFYMHEGLHSLLYDHMYGRHADALGDIAWYEALASQSGPDILVAACGTGRVSSALAKPGRHISGFDASAVLLKQAETRNATLDPACRQQLSQQRLESFDYEQRFDLILLPYYSFSHLLDAVSRQACLQRIAKHLKPDGRAVLHLPAAELLQRSVPPEELAQLRGRSQLRLDNGAELVLEQQVQRMDYLPELGVRVMQLSASLSRSDGQLLKRHPASLYYASITQDMLEAAAADAGLAVSDVLTSFQDQTGSEQDSSAVITELVAVLRQRRQD